VTSSQKPVDDIICSAMSEVPIPAYLRPLRIFRPAFGQARHIFVFHYPLVSEHTHI